MQLYTYVCMYVYIYVYYCREYTVQYINTESYKRTITAVFRKFLIVVNQIKM